MLYYIQKERGNKIKGKDKVNTMTRVEMDKRMKELEQREFIIWMVDRWTDRERRLLADIEREKKELKAKMN